ncbi:hypothetical protein SEVIR_6G000800v4 [Setaria viridis]|uniref:Myb-like domain-containing protein n=1 Tax=Setaria viridis TaxID=4556 RepID=A0A4U6TYC4_SETVI|nr:uncharacterized protein LOC117859618 isoform X2 [Setaria viridis]TKW08010.1 hypothetical protein SEVIR_6G000800v2 [Setaria viridis]
MFGDMAATDSSSMAMAMAFYPLQGQGLPTTSSYNPPHHHNHMLSFTSSTPDPTLMPPATTSSLPSAPKKYKFVTASPADWTAHEVATLEEGLIRYAHEPNITKYIKIAAMLPAKTIRDVALRCCWTPGNETRRRKPDDYYAGENMTYLKNKMAASTSAANVPMPPTNSAFLLPLSLHHPSQNSLVPMEAPVLDSAIQHLLEENNQLLSQIAANIKTFKTEENMDLFLRMNNNIRAISERMRETRGTMGQMPSLPVHVNEEHLSSLVHLHRGGKLDMKLS